MYMYIYIRLLVYSICINCLCIWHSNLRKCLFRQLIKFCESQIKWDALPISEWLRLSGVFAVIIQYNRKVKVVLVPHFLFAFLRLKIVDFAAHNLCRNLMNFYATAMRRAKGSRDSTN